MKIKYKYITILIALFISELGIAQSSKRKLNVKMAQKEAEFYKIVDVPIPKDVKLEVGGLALTKDDKLGVSTRRGELWLIDNPYNEKPNYKLYAHGMHESLGLAYKDNGFYTAQRGELTRIDDKNNDGIADSYKTVASWPLSGNYHEYSYGPKFLSNGDMILTLNLSYSNGAKSLAKWRGWLVKITPEGKFTPMATGLRSPAGFYINDNDDIFYTENQGEWVGSGNMTHLEKGDFAGNAAGLKWTSDPLSPLKLKPNDILKKSGISIYDYAKKIKALKAPAIWLPHAILGISTSDMLADTTKGNFGPFKGQHFIGDQGQSKISRVFMEKVNGVYQGASFPFVEGFSSGVLRMIWGSDNSMFVGMTSRGWSSTGRKFFGLQRLVWSGKTPFEMKTIKALEDGFEIEFTKPIDKKKAEQLSTYNVSTFTYLYHSEYGSPIADSQKAIVDKVNVSKDGLKVKLTVNNMRLGYIHQIEIPKLTTTTGESLLHDTGYYTLNQVPGGVLKSVQVAVKKENKNKVANQPKRVTTMPMAWGEHGAEQKLALATVPGLKYDAKKLVVKRNTNIQLTLNNNDDMLHNMVIMKPGEETPNTVGSLASNLGLSGSKLNYVPFNDLVLFHSGIVKPGESETIYFTAPKQAGEYWIVCTFPGHSFTMRTKLIVK